MVKLQLVTILLLMVHIIRGGRCRARPHVLGLSTHPGLSFIYDTALGRLQVRAFRVVPSGFPRRVGAWRAGQFSLTGKAQFILRPYVALDFLTEVFATVPAGGPCPPPNRRVA